MTFSRLTIPKENILGNNRRLDPRYQLTQLDFRNAAGQIETKYGYLKWDEDSHSGPRRVLDEAKAAYIEGETKGVPYFVEISIGGQTYKDIQFYFEGQDGRIGLPVVSLKNGETYYLSPKEIQARAVRRMIISADSNLNLNLDLPPVPYTDGMRPVSGGGGCPSVEVNNQGLKMSHFGVTPSEDIEKNRVIDAGKYGMVNLDQYFGVPPLFTGESGLLQIQKFNSSKQVAQSSNVRELSAILQDSYSTMGRRGDDDGGDEDGTSRFRRYDRAVKRFNSQMRRNLGIPTAIQSQTQAQPQKFDSFGGKIVIPLRSIQQPTVAQRKKEISKPALKLPCVKKIAETKKKEKSAAVKREKSDVLKSKARKKQAAPSSLMDKKKKAAEKKIVSLDKFRKEKKKADVKAKSPEKPVPEAKATKKQKPLNVDKEKKKTGPKGLSASKAKSSPAKAFEPLAYGLKVRRSGQAELRARQKITGTGLPKSDKSSKCVMVMESNKKSGRAQKPAMLRSNSPFAAGQGKKKGALSAHNRTLWIIGASTSSSRRLRARLRNVA